MNYNREKVINIIRKIYAVYRGRHLVDILVIILSDYLRHKSTQDDWNESDHPRKENGQFGKGGGSSSRSEKSKNQNKAIAGVKQGNPMSPKQAGGLNVNPNYKKGGAYTKNCQTCTLAYNLRLRGYKVRAKGFDPSNSMQLALEKNIGLGWIDPKTGLTPKVFEKNVQNAQECYEMLNSTIQPNQQYDIGWSFIENDKLSGHTINVSKNNKGELILYDPQSGEQIQGNDVINYMESFYYKNPIKLLRTDNLEPFNEIVERVVEPSKK